VSTAVSENEGNKPVFFLSKELEEKGFDEDLQKIIHKVGFSKEYFLKTNQNAGCSTWDDKTLFTKYEPVRRRKMEREYREEWERIVFGLAWIYAQIVRHYWSVETIISWHEQFIELNNLAYELMLQIIYTERISVWVFM